MSRADTEIVKHVVAELLKARGHFQTSELAHRLGLSRQAAHAHLRRLVGTGALRAEGRGRGAFYRSVRRLGPHWTYELELAGLDEDATWTRFEHEVAALEEAPSPAKTLLHFAVTAVLSNARLHSGGTRLEVQWLHRDGALAVMLADDGVGLFSHVRQQAGLASELEALHALSKGTRERASPPCAGLGLFFAARAVDRFTLRSGGLRWVVDSLLPDVALGLEPVPVRGTSIRMELALNTARDLKTLFDAYSDEALAFRRTRAHVKLFEWGTSFVSRREAGALLEGLERFEEVKLDFQGVHTVGWSFLEEVLRRWPLLHPATRITPVQMNPVVASMVSALSRQSEASG